METNMLETALRTADHASQQNGYWLFIAALIVGGLAFAYMLRSVAAYFVKQHERVIADHSEARNSYHHSLQMIVAEQNIVTKQVVAVLERSNIALNGCETELARCREQHERELKK